MEVPVLAVFHVNNKCKFPYNEFIMGVNFCINTNSY